MTREMGFNGAHKRQKAEDPRYVYWADRMGLLVSGEMANAYLCDESYVERITKEWIEVVERDYNHSSIIVWVPINERWGTPDLRDVRQQNHLKAMYALTKSLDATRRVIDNEGWEHTDMTGPSAFHNYLKSRDLLYARYKDLGKSGVPIMDYAGRPYCPAILTMVLPSTFRSSVALPTSAPGSRRRRTPGATRASKRHPSLPWIGFAGRIRQSPKSP